MTIKEAREKLAKVLTEFLHVEATRAEVMAAADAYALASKLEGHVEACRTRVVVPDINNKMQMARCGDGGHCEKAKEIQELGR